MRGTWRSYIISIIYLLYLRRFIRDVLEWKKLSSMRFAIMWKKCLLWHKPKVRLFMVVQWRWYQHLAHRIMIQGQVFWLRSRSIFFIHVFRSINFIHAWMLFARDFRRNLICGGELELMLYICWFCCDAVQSLEFDHLILSRLDACAWFGGSGAHAVFEVGALEESLYLQKKLQFFRMVDLRS